MRCPGHTLGRQRPDPTHEGLLGLGRVNRDRHSIVLSGVPSTYSVNCVPAVPQNTPSTHRMTGCSPPEPASPVTSVVTGRAGMARLSGPRNQGQPPIPTRHSWTLCTLRNHVLLFSPETTKTRRVRLLLRSALRQSSPQFELSHGRRDGWPLWRRRTRYSRSRGLSLHCP